MDKHQAAGRTDGRTNSEQTYTDKQVRTDRKKISQEKPNGRTPNGWTDGQISRTVLSVATPIRRMSAVYTFNSTFYSINSKENARVLLCDCCRWLCVYVSAFFVQQMHLYSILFRPLLFFNKYIFLYTNNGNFHINFFYYYFLSRLSIHGQ